MKNLGYSQNFLVNKKLVERLISKSNIDVTDYVIEIGPGKGIITDVLSQHAGEVVAVEYDQELYKIIYVFLTIFLYLLKCPQSLILSALRAFCFCGKPHISRSIFLYFRYQAWLKSW